MDYSNIPSELRDKARECKNSDELMELAREAGVELKDAELEAVSGGVGWGYCSGYDEDCVEYGKSKMPPHFN